MIKTPGRKGKKKTEEVELDIENYHWDLKSYVQETRHDYQDIIEDYKAFYTNLKKYSSIVPPMFRRGLFLSSFAFF